MDSKKGIGQHRSSDMGSSIGTNNGQPTSIRPEARTPLSHQEALRHPEMFGAHKPEQEKK